MLHTGGGVRIYKLKSFTRFQRAERISDAALVAAVRRAVDGLIEADLHGGLIKQRVAREGQGKSGGYRTLIAFRRGERAVFLFGFAKNMRSNIDADELEDLRSRGQGFLVLAADRLARLVEDGDLTEVTYGEDQNDEKPTKR